jgi:hypothetical protein
VQINIPSSLQKKQLGMDDPKTNAVLQLVSRPNSKIRASLGKVQKQNLLAALDKLQHVMCAALSQAAAAAMLEVVTAINEAKQIATSEMLVQVLTLYLVGASDGILGPVSQTTLLSSLSRTHELAWKWWVMFAVHS